MQPRARSAGITNQHGFTLVDLLISMVVVGVVMTIAVRSFATAVPQWRVKEATSDLVAAIRAVRAKAILEGENAGMTLDLNRGRYVVWGRFRPLSRTSPDPSPSPSVPEGARLASLPEHVGFAAPPRQQRIILEPLDPGGTAIAFDSRGRLRSRVIPAYITVGDARRGIFSRLQIDYIGNVRHQMWRDGRWQ